MTFDWKKKVDENRSKEDILLEFQRVLKDNIDENLVNSKQIVFTTFHQSLSYEDFIEGLRPILDKNDQAQLTLQNGIFKEFCLRAAKWEVEVFNLHLEKEWDQIKIIDLVPYKEQLSGLHWDYIFEIEDQNDLSQGQQRRGGRRRRKVDFIAANHIDYVDYKDVDLLKHFISERGKILPRRVTGTSAKNQRKVTTAIKRARIMALLPFVTED